jgi:hypothetical protein
MRAGARAGLPMLRLICAAALLAPAIDLAAGAEAPTLPPSAKRISGATITRLYDGKTFTFKSFTFYGVVTGEVSYDFSAGANHGSYQLDAHQGTFDGKIRVSGDKFCYLAGYNDERCNSVYVDGVDIYEVRQSGIVESVKRAAISK